MRVLSLFAILLTSVILSKTYASTEGPGCVLSKQLIASNSPKPATLSLCFDQHHVVGNNHLYENVRLSNNEQTFVVPIGYINLGPTAEKLSVLCTALGNGAKRTGSVVKRRELHTIVGIAKYQAMLMYNGHDVGSFNVDFSPMPTQYGSIGYGVYIDSVQCH